MSTKITVIATIDASIETVWNNWTSPEHIVNWNNASDDWHTPKAENDLRTGGKFLSRMEAKDGSFGFDFEGIYDLVETHKTIEYTLPDGRHVAIQFQEKGNQTEVTETFDPENQNPPELQQQGWQMILNNFKKYTENRG